MDELIRKLAQARAESAQAREKTNALMEQVKQSPEYIVESTKLETANATIDELTARIKEQAESVFQSSGEKHPHEAVEIKSFDTVSFSKDGDDLRDWCLVKLPGVLRVDMKALEKAAKAGVVEISNVKKQPKVYIKQDLSGWL